MTTPVPSRSMSTRSHIALLVATSLTAATSIGACGPEFVSSSLAASLGESTNPDGNNDGDESTAWLVVSGILLASSAVFSVLAISDEDLLAYMENHQRDIDRALATGQGAFPSDLAQSLGLPEAELPHVAALLRDARPWLAPSLAPTPDGKPITREAAREFWGQLLLLLERDPITRPHLERLKVRALASVLSLAPPCPARTRLAGA